MKFIGNVLPKTGHKPENDSTFDFTSEESRRMNLEGVPLRIEHADSLPIGKVTKSWDGKNGSKWIMGELDTSRGDLTSNYAKHAMKPDSKGHTLYTGLSLQHVHQSWPDGTTNKRPVEISICTEPRRPDCYIRAVGETGKNEYIEHKASIKSIMSTEQSNSQVTEQSPVESTPVQEAVEGKTTATSSETPVQNVAEQEARNVANSQEELMKMFLDQDSKNAELMTQLEAMKKAKNALESKWAEREENETIQTQSKAEALSKALIESWSNQLGAENMSEENKKAIFALAHNHPKLAMPMMEIAHKASMKHANTRSALIESEAMSKKRVLEQQVVDTIMKRRRTSTPQEVSHAASTKKQVQEPVQHKFNPFAGAKSMSNQSGGNFKEQNSFLFGALQGISSGNARSMMDNIAKYRNGNM